MEKFKKVHRCTSFLKLVFCPIPSKQLITPNISIHANVKRVWHNDTTEAFCQALSENSDELTCNMLALMQGADSLIILQVRNLKIGIVHSSPANVFL